VDELLLHPSLVTVLVEARPVFAKPSDGVFKTTPILRTFKVDLLRAGIVRKNDYGPIVTADDGGRALDRHALRTTFETWLSKHGVHSAA